MLKVRNKGLILLSLMISTVLFVGVHLHNARGDIILEEQGKLTCERLIHLQESAGSELDTVREKLNGHSKPEDLKRAAALMHLMTTLDSWYHRHCEVDPNAIT